MGTALLAGAQREQNRAPRGEQRWRAGWAQPSLQGAKGAESSAHGRAAMEGRMGTALLAGAQKEQNKTQKRSTNARSVKKHKKNKKN